MKKAIWLSIVCSCALWVASPVTRAQQAAAGADKSSWSDKLSVSGFGVLWFMPLRDENFPADKQKEDAFRIRFARIIVKAKPSEAFSAKVGLGLENAAPFYDLQLIWKPSPMAQLTVGQFKIPFGVAIPSSAPNLMMMDRPAYAPKMIKSAFRDVGVMVSAPKNGVAGGMFEYYAGIFSGNGRTTLLTPRADRKLGDYLLVGRGVVNVGASVLGDKSRLALGVSYARSTDPALDPMDTAGAKNHLGSTLTAFAERRDTQVVGVDVNLKHQGIFLLSELFFMDSTPKDSGVASQQALGFNVDVGYMTPWQTQVAARVEWFDADQDVDNDEKLTFAFGGNYLATEQAWLSLFVTRVQFTNAMGESTAGHRVETRFRLKF